MSYSHRNTTSHVDAGQSNSGCHCFRKGVCRVSDSLSRERLKATLGGCLARSWCDSSFAASTHLPDRGTS
eukprot:4715474-Amphidinium_carterae.1